MSSHRPYRPAMGIDKAVEYLNQESGKTLDAKIVNIVNDLIKQKDFQAALCQP
jgi:HD-GYP domain-containing protein (c-di-GMP phosphodiesterase class II)